MCKSLPEQYTAEPRVRLGSGDETHDWTFNGNGGNELGSSASDSGTAIATWAPPEPTLTLDVFCQTDPAFAPAPPATYAVTCRSHNMVTRSRFESWAYPMVVGERLPVLPIWLDNDHAISLDLETSYQQTCSALRLI